MTTVATAFNLDRLYEILAACTVQLRKGEAVTTEQTGPLKVMHVYMMPHESEAKPHVEKVDLHFILIGVDKTVAESHRAEVVAILDAYPQPERLAAGPSYIEVGGVIGDQGATFQLFALGKALGLWSIITPATFHMTGAEADQMAGMGYIMVSGYKPRAGTVQPQQETLSPSVGDTPPT